MPLEKSRIYNWAVAENQYWDEFEDIQGSGGKHRARRTAAARFREFLAWSLFTTVITVSGYVALRGVDSASILVGSVTGEEPLTDDLKVLNPVVAAPGVVVLDATGQQGVASKMAASLLASDWYVLSASNLSLDAEDAAPAASQILISSESYRELGEKLAQELTASYGITPAVTVDSARLDAITLVITSDYQISGS